jgi:hypothetical protein
MMLVSSDGVVLRPVAAVQGSSGVRGRPARSGEIWWRWSLVWSWTADCKVSGGRARFGFPQAPVDLLADVTIRAGQARPHARNGRLPVLGGSTWEWELGEAARAQTGSGVLFRHYGFGEEYAEIDLAHTAQTWALILARLAGYLATGTPQPFFPAPA